MAPSIPPDEAQRLIRDDGLVEALFPFYQQVSPEEFVARRSLSIMCWGFGQYEYPDPEFTRWIQRVTELLASLKASDQCRKQFLTPEEYARAQAALEAMKAPDYSS